MICLVACIRFESFQELSVYSDTDTVKKLREKRTDVLSGLNIEIRLCQLALSRGILNYGIL